MKKLYTLLLASVCTLGALNAQNPTAYFMDGTTVRSQFNPAFAPHRGYVNIPALGGISISENGNISLGNILFPRDGKLVTIFDTAVSADDALANLKPNNQLSADTRINLIGFGAYTANRHHFWAFDLNLRTNAEVHVPYSLFEFLKRGESANIRDIGITADSYLEAAFSYSFGLLDNRLYVGARAKMLIGAARGALNYDTFNVTMHEDQWTIDASGDLDLSVAETTVHPNEQGTYHPNDLNLEPRKPAGYGFALDLGATYDILPDLQASFAVNDLGFISWSKSNNVTGRSVKQLAFSGVEIDQNGTAVQPAFDLDVLEFTPQAPQSHTRMLRATINAGLEYRVWRHKIGFGLLYSARFNEYKNLHNLTGSVNFQPIEWFTLTGSYSVIGNRGNAVGLAINLCPSWINFFIATDMLLSEHTPQWIPIRQSMMNVTLGLGIPIGKRGERRIDRFEPARW